MTTNELRFPETVTVTEQEIDLGNMAQPEREICIAEAKRLYADWKASGGRRVVGIGGPSGSGKSVFVAIMRDLIFQIDPDARFIGLTIDAYHFHNATLKEQGLDQHKGRYDTYDVPHLLADLTAFKSGDAVAFPAYSRKIHEPIADHERIGAHAPALLLVEGLWVFLPKYGWEGVMPLCDDTIFLEGAPEKLRERTIGRHMKGGRERGNAERFYESSDVVNSALVMATRGAAAKVLSV